jgi:hypothetical protein
LSLAGSTDIPTTMEVAPYLIASGEGESLDTPMELPYRPASGVFEADSKRIKFFTGNVRTGISITLDNAAEMIGVKDQVNRVPLTISMALPGSGRYTDLVPGVAQPYSNTETGWDHTSGTGSTRAPFSMKVSSPMHDPASDNYIGHFTVLFAPGT